MNAVRRTCPRGRVGALTLGACGGSSGSNCNTNPTGPGCPPPPTTLTPCTQAVVLSGQGQLPAQSADYETFTTSATGRLDIALDWTFTSSMMAVLVVRAGSCPFDQLKAGTCTFPAQGGGPGTGVPPGTKPLKISTPNFTAGAYNLIIAMPPPRTSPARFRWCSPRARAPR